MKASALIGALSACLILVAGYLVIMPALEQGNTPKLEPLGGIPGNETFTKEFTFNGVKYIHERVSMVQGTTTPCFIKPSASSTLMFASSNWRTASTSQNELGKATTQYATTTRIGSLFTTTNLIQDIFVASTTLGLAASNFGPSDYLVWKMGEANTTTNSPVGFCEAVFIAN